MFHDYLGRVGILLIIIHNFLHPLNQGGNLLTLNNCWYLDWAYMGIVIMDQLIMCSEC